MNWVHLGGSFYVCRTQAGFKQAVKHFMRSDSLIPAQRCNIEGYPTSYPALVSLTTGYRGYTYIQANSIHLKALRMKLSEIDPIKPVAMMLQFFRRKP